ncbi:hypothetical protein EYF80_037446 [Liparis tanakae]|uniref:Uncharacterized protein n=1 Tax=Liparis tanakae TaxID=230148 RepID=A0A4Z2GHJ3_9TELE|nr:hypothetical protein EYF80_037446 [Liparis tanakae]
MSWPEKTVQQIPNGSTAPGAELRSREVELLPCGALCQAEEAKQLPGDNNTRSVAGLGDQVKLTRCGHIPPRHRASHPISRTNDTWSYGGFFHSGIRAEVYQLLQSGDVAKEKLLEDVTSSEHRRLSTYPCFGSGGVSDGVPAASGSGRRVSALAAARPCTAAVLSALGVTVSTHLLAALSGSTSVTSDGGVMEVSVTKASLPVSARSAAALALGVSSTASAALLGAGRSLWARYCAFPSGGSFVSNSSVKFPSDPSLCGSLEGGAESHTADLPTC